MSFEGGEVVVGDLCKPATQTHSATPVPSTAHPDAECH